ncbi:MAG: hypothetical protein ABS63_05610 [Microbacterium sp. SCN 70-27]|uniref:thiamine pyrophosphate-dependent enzyme n=1 Tax=unclassified Microbacterium TaxID=2609290 RepID=UPI000868D3BE|nr:MULTISPECIES: thiamine pyrophosphate-dependent enzyme [unclassified Microbacterium]MBN9225621.1 hypothetical protein [Microbacterium sp.]ODT28054.1 MAG: hypothetical protein ABS63_05610 [Microbacterium sp. SCN 70-27]
MEKAEFDTLRLLFMREGKLASAAWSLYETEAPAAVESQLDEQGVSLTEWTSADTFWARLSFDRPRSYFFPASGGLGWALPAAVGAGLAEPRRPIVALIGDGAMQYTPAALSTAAQYDVPVTFVVCQNQEYGALQRFAKVMQVPDAPYLDLPGLDPASIARGYGIETVQIGSLDELEAFVAAGTEATSPRLAVVPQRSVR